MAIFDTDYVNANNSYAEILDAGLSFCDLALFVVRNGEKLSEKGLAIIEEVNLFNVAEQEMNSWPGTKLLCNTARVFYFSYSLKTVVFLKKHATHFSEWQHPFLPEDLCLLRADKSPWFVSIVHEKELYFDLLDSEINDVKHLVPQSVFKNLS